MRFGHVNVRVWVLFPSLEEHWIYSHVAPWAASETHALFPQSSWKTCPFLSGQLKHMPFFLRATATHALFPQGNWNTCPFLSGQLKHMPFFLRATETHALYLRATETHALFPWGNAFDLDSRFGLAGCEKFVARIIFLAWGRRRKLFHHDEITILFCFVFLWRKNYLLFSQISRCDWNSMALSDREVKLKFVESKIFQNSSKNQMGSLSESTSVPWNYISYFCLWFGGFCTENNNSRPYIDCFIFYYISGSVRRFAKLSMWKCVWMISAWCLISRSFLFQQLAL